MHTTVALALLGQLLAMGPAGVSACLTNSELHGGQHLSRRQIRGTPSNLTNDATIPIGKGDRFSDGAIAPIGIGSEQPSNFTTVYNTAEIASATRALAREYNLEYFEAPHKTYHNTTMFGLKLPSSGPTTVFLEAGIHARERGGPDHLLNFLSDLLWAERHGTGLLYGGVEYSAEDVQCARSVGVVVLPNVNPDGIAYDHETNSCWRKNRNPASANPDDADSIGVDLNRNFPPAWEYEKSMAPNATQGTISNDPRTVVFRGAIPLSEPEAKNIAWTMEQMPDLKWFLDLHSIAGQMLYGSGFDTNQFKDEMMNVLNSSYNGRRGIIPDDRAKGYVYAEYYPQEEYDKSLIVAGSVADALLASGGRPYFAQQSAGLYPAPGGSSDLPMFRALHNQTKHWANGFTLEFGQPNSDALCEFYPTVEMHKLNMIETGAALVAFLLSAARND